jgi:hypothetical protein
MYHLLVANWNATTVATLPAIQHIIYASSCVGKRVQNVG